MHTQRRLGRTVVGIAIAAALVAAACNGGGDKAGGNDRTAPIVLTLATTQAYLPGELAQFPADVERLSGGTVRIEVTYELRFAQADQQRGLIGAVQAGQADLGWVESSAFDEVGVTTLQPLVAPFLIDSYELEGKVFDSGLPERMLQGLDGIGLTGIGILPGPMRRLLGVNRPFANQTDFDGAVVGTSGGQLAQATFAALGATARTIPARLVLDGLDGLDTHLAAIVDGPYDKHGVYLTGNVDLWPRPLAVFANAGRFGRLSPRQQQVVRDALAGEIAPALAVSRRDDASAVPGLCGAGMNVVEAGSGDVSSLHAAVSSLLGHLGQDPGPKAALDAIQALKTQLAIPAETVSCPSPPTPAPSAATPLDGVYEMSETAGELEASGDLVIPENWGSFVYAFDRGRFVLSQENPGIDCTWQYGTYTVDGDHVELTYVDGGGVTPNNATNRPGEDFVYHWSLYRDELSFSVVPGKESPVGLTAKPWHRLDVAPTLAALNQHCPPPDDALWPPSNAATTTTTS